MNQALPTKESMARLLEFEESRGDGFFGEASLSGFTDYSREQPAADDLYQYNTALLKSCGEDVRIFSDALFKRPQLVTIGSHCAIEGYFVCTTQLEIGSYCHISYAVVVIGGANALLRMGHFSHLAPGARLVCSGDKHMGDGLVSPVVPEKYRDIADNRPIIIGNFATVGTGSVVMPGVTLGDGAVLGANSFANRDIPEWEIWAGSPAKFIKKRKKEIMLANARALGYEL